MYQLVPVAPKLEKPSYIPMLTLHAPEDFVLRGIVSKDNSPFELMVGGSEGVSDGDVKLNCSGDEYCYNFIPVEIPVNSGQLVKIYKPNQEVKLSLLSDKGVDLRRRVEDWNGRRLTWTEEPAIVDDEYLGKAADLNSLSGVSVHQFTHEDVHVVLGVRFPNWKTGDHSYDIISVRSDAEGSNRYVARAYSEWDGSAYYRFGVRLVKVVAGAETILASGYTLYSGFDFGNVAWTAVLSINKTYLSLELSGGGGTWLYATHCMDSDISSGEYIALTPGDVRLGQIEVY